MPSSTRSSDSRSPFHAAEDLRIEAVQTDCDPAQPGVAQRLDPARQQTAVGRDGEVENGVDRGEAADQLVDAVAQQGLAPR